MSSLFPIYYETFGNPRHPCMILIMGIGGQLIHWPEKLTRGLADKGFYVVTLDNRDSGLSKHYEDLKTPNLAEAIAAKQHGKTFHPPYTLEEMAADVILLMNELKIKQAHIVGISMGGIIAQLLALKFPEHVLSLTCIASTSGDPNLPPAKPEVLAYFSRSLELALSLEKQEEDLKSYVDNKVEHYKIYHHPSHIDEDKVRESYIKTYHRSHHSSGFGRQILAMICADSRVEKLKKLTLPTLIIHGDFDPVFSIEHGKQLAILIPDSSLKIIENMGHGLPECLCEEVLELIAERIARSG